MRILITGIAGFVGSRLALSLAERYPDWTIAGIDNLSRRGCEINLPLLRGRGVKFIHGDVRNREDVDELPEADWLIDCAANPSVLAGIEGGASQLVQHNLVGTLNLLEKCRRDTCGFLMLGTSRVYSIEALAGISMRQRGDRFEPDAISDFPLRILRIGCGRKLLDFSSDLSVWSHQIGFRGDGAGIRGNFWLSCLD